MARKLNEDEERARLTAMRVYEHEYEAQGLVCGIDEAGRGPLAGPVVAAAVILPRDIDIYYLNDSKKVTERRREILYDEICEKAIAYGIGIVGPDVIDDINILQATYQAMRLAIAELAETPAVLLNDAVTIPGVSIPQVPIIKGDAKSVSIAAASILAKVTRDRMMRQYRMKSTRNTVLPVIRAMERRLILPQSANTAPVRSIVLLLSRILPGEKA